MAIKPILFNTQMVKAILSGNKTQTRRLIKPQPTAVITDSPELMQHFAPYKPGDILWVRETCYKDAGRYMYKADYPDAERFYINGKETTVRWRPSIHMPREAARIFLRVTNVKDQRLHDSFNCISSPILYYKAEGIDIDADCNVCIFNYGFPACLNSVDEDGTSMYDDECGGLDDVRTAFATLWDSTVPKQDIKNYGWAANPWVWVYSFKRCERPEAF